MIQDALNIFYFNSALNIGVTLRALQDKGVLAGAGGTQPDDGQRTAGQVSGGRRVPLSGDSRLQWWRFTSRDDSVPPLRRASWTSRPTCIRMDRSGCGSNREVSTLDYANAVKISGYTIPAISTRKADTEIELQRWPELRHLRAAGQSHHRLD